MFVTPLYASLLVLWFVVLSARVVNLRRRGILFGDNGEVNLRSGITDKFPSAAYGISSPPTIYRDLVIVGPGTQEGNRLIVGDLMLDEDSHEVRRGGEQIVLTATEFELLRYMMRNPRRVLSKAQILDRVWRYDFGGQANVVEIYICYLRKKIDAGRPPMIHTLRGAGYVLKPAA